VSGLSTDGTEQATSPPTSPALRTRRVDIELMRVLAVIGVIAIHVSSGALTETTVQRHGLTYYEATLMDALARWAVPVFVAIAGWALLARRPAEREDLWLAKRAIRLVVPLLAWSLIYVVWALAQAGLTGEHLWFGKSSLLDWLSDEARLFYTGTGVRAQLWFVYALILATLIVWLIQTAGRIRNRAAYLGACFVLVLLWGLPPILQFAETWTTDAWVFGYFGLGWVVLEWGEPGGRMGRWLGVGLFAGASALVMWGNLAGIAWVHSPVSPVVFTAAVGAMLLFRDVSISPGWRARINALGALTFGVFLVHELALDLVQLTWRTGAPLAFLTGGQQTALLLPASAVLSFAMAWLWHRWRPLVVALG
jgi:surface polysaccharide O-acyltransferase-like enzyme